MNEHNIGASSLKKNNPMKLQDILYNWFLSYGRDLPWRHNPTPYEVWVSEVMLQQTQVVTVKPYYLRWMQRFPNLLDLANAPIDDVLKIWSGLGYYRRAHYLHNGAKYLVAHHNGSFPSSVRELKKIPGVGDYTANAIAAFAFAQNTPAIDGNVERVLSRFYGIDGDLKHGKPRKLLSTLASTLVENGHAREINQAIMDWGASFCGKSPNCNLCPAAPFCFACQNGKTLSLPQKQQRTEKYHDACAALILHSQDHRLLIGQNARHKLLGSLWSFPIIRLAHERGINAEKKMDGILRQPRSDQWLSYFPHADIRSIHPTGIAISHVFTHIHMHLVIDDACLPNLPSFLPNNDYDAWTFASLTELTAPSPAFPLSELMKKMLRQLNADKIEK